MGWETLYESMTHLQTARMEDGELVTLVVAGEVEDDAGGADDELDVGLLEQFDQRPDQALHIADVVRRVREVPGGIVTGGVIRLDYSIRDSPC